MGSILQGLETRTALYYTLLEPSNCTYYSLSLDHLSRCEDPQFNMQSTISILGAGPAGFALAADLQSHGKEVLVYSHPNHLRHTKDVIDKGFLRATGAMHGFMDVRVTSDMSEVVEFSKIMILTVPSTGQETVLRELEGFDLRQHIFIAIPGNMFSLIAAAKLQVGFILETNLSPYSCRMEDGNLVVLGKKNIIYIASLQQNLSPAFRGMIQDIFSVQLKWCSSIIEVCLSNVNGVFHPLMMLMNAGRIENTGGDFLLYSDGLTRSVANAMEVVDKVRMQIGQAFKLYMKTAIEVSNECYNQNFMDLMDLAQNSTPHKELKAPSDIKNRNISEDVPDLLVCWCSLAEKLGIDVSPIKAIIILIEMATGADYMKSGRNLSKLHLENVSRANLVKRFGPYLESSYLIVRNESRI
ncbi:hypothetical protein ACMFMG_008351 [Clarireedia jacksonii]